MYFSRRTGHPELLPIKSTGISLLRNNLPTNANEFTPMLNTTVNRGPYESNHHSIDVI